jgi:hypothetical protein
VSGYNAAPVRACLLPLLLVLVPPAGLLLPAGARADPEVLADPVAAGELELRPPRGFWPLELDVQGSAALAPGGPEVARLVLALAERRVDAASFTVSIADEPMPAGPDARDRVARQVLDHFGSMGVELRLRWTTPLQRPRGAVEVVGRMSVQGEDRVLVVAAGPLGPHQWMATLSAPPQRLEELLGPFEASVASLRGDPFAEPPGLPSDGLILVGCAALGALVAAGSRIARRRRAAGLQERTRAAP